MTNRIKRNFKISIKMKSFILFPLLWLLAVSNYCIFAQQINFVRVLGACDFRMQL